jgi:hypothetical protein
MEYLVLDEPEPETPKTTGTHDLVEFVGRVKERLKAKTGWGRNEIIAILDGEFSKSPVSDDIEKELGF